MVIMILEIVIIVVVIIVKIKNVIYIMDNVFFVKIILLEKSVKKNVQKSVKMMEESIVVMLKLLMIQIV